MATQNEKRIQTLDILWGNTLNLIAAAGTLLSSKRNISYAFVLLQTASEEMGRIWALWLHFDGHQSVPVPPKDRHLDKHSYFVQFMSFQPVGQRTYFEIISDIIGTDINKENSKKIKTLEKIQKFREKSLYVSLDPNTHRVTAQPWDNETGRKAELVKELHGLLNTYMVSMLGRLIQQYTAKVKGK